MLKILSELVHLFEILHGWRVYKGESHENLRLHVASKTAIFSLLLRHHVAFLHRTATYRPLFKLWVSLLSTYRQSSCVSNFCRTFKVFIWLSLVISHSPGFNKDIKKSGFLSGKRSSVSVSRMSYWVWQKARKAVIVNS